MVVSLDICPKCGGAGRPRYPHDLQLCELCGGTGSVPDDFLEKTRQRQKSWTSCDHCFAVRWCVTVPGKDIDRQLCGVCYTQEKHPHLVAQTEEAPF